MAYRQKNYYNARNNKRKPANKLEPNISGFICTCNNIINERDCVREAYNLLNEFADDLFGPEIQQEVKIETEEAAGGDIDSELADEVNALKAEAAKKPDLRRFQVVDSGAKNVVFVKTTVPDPVQLAYKIALTIAETKQQRSKFLLRMTPVEATCKANMDDITKTSDVLLDKYFAGEAKTFAIVYSHRNNDSIKRTELTEILAGNVMKRNSQHKADLKQPQLIVNVEIIRSICCLAVVPDYYILKKYNLLELAGVTSVKPAVKTEEQQGEDLKPTADAEG